MKRLFEKETHMIWEMMFEKLFKEIYSGKQPTDDDRKMFVFLAQKFLEIAMH